LRLQEYEEARALSELYLSYDENNQLAVGVAGVASYFLGHFEQANSFLTDYLVGAEDDPDIRQVLAATKLALREPDEAYELLEPSENLSGATMTYRTLAGFSAFLTGREGDGLRYLESAAAAKPDDGGARLRLGGVRIAAGHLDEVENDLQDAMLLDPSVESSTEMRHMQLGLVSSYLQDGLFEKGLAAALRFQHIRPDVKDGFVLAGIAYGELGRMDEARAEYAKALEIVPGAPDANTNLAIIEIQQGNLDQARAFLVDIIDHRPDHHRTLIVLAAIDARRNNSQLTMAWLSRAILANPAAVDSRVYLARHYLAVGNTVEASKAADAGVTYRFPSRAGTGGHRSRGYGEEDARQDSGDKEGFPEP
jgi:tetratricopeptide (TPR) repeat protein